MLRKRLHPLRTTVVLVFSFRIIANLWQPKSSFRFHSDIEYDRRVVNNFYCIFWQLLKTGGTFTNTDSTSPKSISRKIRFKRQTPNTMRCTCPVYGTVVISYCSAVQLHFILLRDSTGPCLLRTYTKQWFFDDHINTTLSTCVTTGSCTDHWS